MQKHIEDFLTELRLSGRSPNTVRTYRVGLEKFQRWAAENGLDLGDVTPRRLKAYRNCLAASCAPASVNNFISALKSFFDYLVEEGIVPGNPVLVRRLSLPNPRKAPRYLTREEVKKVLSCLEARKPEHVALAFRTMLHAGLRVSEVAGLSPRDVVERDGLVVVRVRQGKRGKSRYAPVVDSHTARDLLALRDRRKNEPSLFGVKASTLVSHAEDVARQTGVDFTSHRLRHTFATRMLEQDWPLDVLQEALGHSDISTTRIYAATLPDRFFRYARRAAGQAGGEEATAVTA